MTIGFQSKWLDQVNSSWRSVSIDWKETILILVRSFNKSHP